MESAGLPLLDRQRLFYIDAIFAEGGRRAAIEQWEDARTPLITNMDTREEYWALGVMMYCQTLQFDRALKAAEALIQGSEDATAFRILIPIIRGFLSSESKDRAPKAWALYIRLRLGLGPQMNMGDYDAVASIFLTADLPDLALGVFKDMMLTGDASAERQDSTALYRTATGVTNDLNLMKIDERELNWEDSKALATLPARFNNKFFLGKWLKKLIGDGELDAAGKVVNLMHERRIRPDAKHINGLIGAWLRSGTPRNQKLAEDMAWRMIKERLEFVEARDATYSFEGPLRGVRGGGKLSHRPIVLFPCATIETYSVLIEHYRRRQRHDLMKDIFASLQRAKIPPNTFFMNQLLMVDSQSQKYWAWDTYTALVQQYGVRPDFNTYGYLWHLAKKAVDPVLNRRAYKSPFLSKDFENGAAPRFLFAEMAKWRSSLTKKEKLPRELYDLIILSFSLAHDQPGTAVALRALQRHFNMYPNEHSVRTIVLQLTRVGIKNEVGLPPRRLNLNKSPQVKERVAQVTKIMQEFKKQRVEALRQQGIVFEELEGDAKLEESLILLSDLLRFVQLSRLFEGQSVTELSRAAAEQMGVPDCATWVSQNHVKESV
jgi:pentatricopeptide repeat protein